MQPLVSGIYSADPTKLSLAATLPRFLDMEREHGSLTAAMQKKRAAAPAGQNAPANDTGARYSLFMTPRDGMSRLVEAAAAKLPPGGVRLATTVEQLERTPAGVWRLHWRRGQETGVDEADRLVIAARSDAAARLLRPQDATLADELEAIPLAGCSIVCLGFRRAQFARPLQGFGFVVPAVERRRIFAGSYSSQKFPGRAAEDHVLLRAFIGGATQAELNDLPDDELERIALEELQDLLGITGGPLVTRIARWRRAMPQYHVGHLARVTRIEARIAALGSLALAGNAYRGVGVPHCIKSGESAAEWTLGTDPP